MERKKEINDEIIKKGMDSYLNKIEGVMNFINNKREYTMTTSDNHHSICLKEGRAHVTLREGQVEEGKEQITDNIELLFLLNNMPTISKDKKIEVTPEEKREMEDTLRGYRQFVSRNLQQIVAIHMQDDEYTEFQHAIKTYVKEEEELAKAQSRNQDKEVSRIQEKRKERKVEACNIGKHEKDWGIDFYSETIR